MEVLAIDREAAEALVLAGYTTIGDLQKADVLDLAMIRPVGTTGAQWIKAKLSKMMSEGGRGVVPPPAPMASSVPEPSEATSTPPPPEPAKVAPPPSPPPEPARAPPTPAPVKEAATPAPVPAKTPPASEPVKEAATPAPAPVKEAPPVQPAGSLPPPPHIQREQGKLPPPPHITGEHFEAPTLRPPPETAEKETVPAPVETPAVAKEPVPTPPEEPTPAAPVAGAGTSPGFMDFVDRRRTPLTIGAIAVIALLIGVFVIWPLFAVEKAPDFEIRTIDGEKIRLSDFRGDKIVLLDFMFAECTGCKKGIPHLKEVYEKYGDEIVILSVSDVEGAEERERLRDLKEETGAEWIFGQIDPKVTIDYSVDLYPTYFIIDKEGYVTFKSSYADADKLSEEIDKVKEGRAERLAVVSLGVYGLAFVAGMVTFFSPCAYPLMPAYMSYYVTMDSKDEEEDVRKAMKRGAIQGTIPAMAMLMFFGTIGLIVGIFGYIIFGFLGYIGLVMGIMILGFGFAMLRDIDIPFHIITTPLKDIASKLYHLVKKLTGGIVSKETAEKGIARVTGKEVKLDSDQGAFGLFTYGLVYAAASSACVAPLFILVLTVGIAQGGVFAGFMVVLLYGLGMGVLMVTFTALIAGSKMKLINFMKIHMKTIERVSGIVMMIAGLMLIYFWYAAEVAA